MEGCSVARMMSLWRLAIRQRNMCSLVLPNLLGLPPRLLNKFRKEDPPLIVGTSQELPEDILMCIFATVETTDLIRAGSVCSSWHSAYTKLCDLGLFRHSQTPCLLYTSESAGESIAGLYSLAEKKSYTLTLPDPPIRSRYVIGSNHGWIITADNNSELHLVNPITGDQIGLPSVTTIDKVKPIYDDNGAVHKYEFLRYGDEYDDEWPSIFDLGKLRDHLFYKAFLSSDPSSGNYYVVLIYKPDCELLFARGGDDKWTRLPPHVDCSDCIVKDDLFYVSTLAGAIHAFDTSGPTVTQKTVLEEVKDDICEKIYIVQAPCGDLLQIWRDNKPPEDYEYVSEPEIDAEYYACRSVMFKVHKVDLAAKQLVEISSFGENVLFLGHNPSLCLSADEYPQLKENHVYFTDDCVYLAFEKNDHRYIRVLNLEDNSMEEIVSPQLWSNWPAPVWVIPNPRKMNSASQSNLEGSKLKRLCGFSTAASSINQEGMFLFLLI